jgi:hypothetical protein
LQNRISQPEIDASKIPSVLLPQQDHYDHTDGAADAMTENDGPHVELDHGRTSSDNLSVIPGCKNIIWRFKKLPQKIINPRENILKTSSPERAKSGEPL